MKDSANRPNTTATARPLNYSPNIKQNLKTEIVLRFCFAPLLVVSGFGLLLLPILLLTEQLVMN
jgi:hypothetical protein